MIKLFTKEPIYSIHRIIKLEYVAIHQSFDFRNEDKNQAWWRDLLQVPGLAGNTSETGPLSLG